MKDSARVEFLPLRRTLLLHAAGCFALGVMGVRTRASADTPPSGDTVSIENFAPTGNSLGVIQVLKIVKTEAEWRQMLSPESYEITRRAGTERAGSGKYAFYHAAGLYRCICCDTALYDSKTKFESGTGWPSFWQPISERNIVKTSDHSFMMIRDAISCRRCDAHLGHVFDDGPKPTGLRYCMNSGALNFVARA